MKHTRIPKIASSQCLIAAKGAVYSAAWLDCFPIDEFSLQSPKGKVCSL